MAQNEERRINMNKQTKEGLEDTLNDITHSVIQALKILRSIPIEEDKPDSGSGDGKTSSKPGYDSFKFYES
jgi:hypothetical protein